MKILNRPITFLIIAIFISSCNIYENKTDQHTNLRCENLEIPIAIDIPSPLLSWNLVSEKRGQIQSAYRIIVAGSKKNLADNIGDFWDTGKIDSNVSVNIKYEGKSLKSRDVLYWKVKTWNGENVESEWSKTSKWEMSFLEQADWQAKWIGTVEDENPFSYETGPAPYFRHEINLSKKISSAKVYVSGLGYYELYLNGEKVGDEVLAPAQTNYDKRALPKILYHYDDQSTTRVFYNTFDVTNQLQKGLNAIGMLLGNGWYNQRDRVAEGDLWYSTPRLIFQLEIEYSDGEKEIVTSNESWKVSTDAFLHDGIFTGEIYDARLENEGWNMPGFNDENWQQAQLVKAPSGKMESQLAPPDKVVRTFKPTSILIKEDSTIVVDAGEMISGWIRLRINEKSGQEITMRFIEEMGSDYGQKDIYITKGSGNEIYEPRFTWHAFRTIEITGITQKLTKDDIDIVVVNTDVPTAGSFKCSNELFNKIQENYIRTQLGNFHGSISSDCPHRERLGYTGDGSILVESSILNFDMTNFYQKWVNDMDDARNKNTGFVPHTAPFGGGGGGPAWGSAYVITPWFYYLYYGNSRILEQHYSGMKQWVDYLGTRTDENGIVVREEPRGWCLGDWATPDKIEIPPDYVNTCYYFYVADLMSKIATVVGNNSDAEYFSGLAINIKEVVNTHFFDSDKKQYWEGKQGANVFALAFGIVPEEYVEDVLKNLAQNISKNKGHLDTGILATPLLLDILTKYGMEDLAFSIMNQRDYPGFGDYILGKGATTLWENWNGDQSHSHPMHGSVVRWFYQWLAGIYPDEENPGFKNIIIKPSLCGDLKFASADYNSVYGKISSSWKLEAGDLLLDVEIPANTTATIYIPSTHQSKITEGGKAISEVQGIEFVNIENNKTVYKVGSGKHNFISEDVTSLIQPVMHTSTPSILPGDTLFTKPDFARFYIVSATKGAKIYYTIDGSVPTESSTFYEKLFLLDDAVIIKAVAYKNGLLPSYIQTERVKFVDTEFNGLSYTVYEGEWEQKPDISKLKEVACGVQYDFNLDKIKKREDYIVVIFKGFIEIENPGLYTFYSSANNGSWFYIDNKLIVDNPSGTERGDIRLEKGKYPLKVIYFENFGTESLDVFMRGPGMEKQAIPPSLLFFE
ncbi:MAG: family 78 glycoside hydrolase catalytic domain [Draconibacterium sp.]|nr:family 78 glycoside hydrolase catalytic domain [Draconibacterium sp.]